MIITLIFISAGLSLNHYLEAENFLAYILTLPVEYYVGSLIFLIVLRIILAINKYIPVVRRLFKAFERVRNNSSAILQRLDRDNRSNGVNKSSARKYSTQCRSSASQSKTTGPSSNHPSSSKAGRALKEDAQPSKYFIKDLLSAVRITSVDVNAMSVVKGGAWWVNKVIRLLPSIGLSTTGPRVRAIVVILRKFSAIGKSQGIKGLVIYLKACHVCLTQALAGHMIKDTGALNCRVSRTNTGIPRIILATDRALMRSDHFGIIRFYQTVFGLYRILSFEGKLKLGSITNPFTGSMQYITTEILPMVPIFINLLYKEFPRGFPAGRKIVSWKGITKVTQVGTPDMLQDLKSRYTTLSPIWLAKSAAGTKHDEIEVSSHPFLMVRTAATIFKSSIWPDFKAFMELLPVNSAFGNAFHAALLAKDYMKPLYTLGKLGIKEEAAGKVRVFAMVPTWFQVLLKPLHQQLFDILRVIPQDGTFNQLAPLRRMHKYGEAFSLDLTAATDRLPLVIQTVLLGELLGSMKLATSWANLLTGIEYLISSPKYNTAKVVKYQVGQPMGALSSWAMLAFTHHFLVQVSAWRSGLVPQGVWFKDYAILGDDLVIFNRIVALEYIKVIKNIGMEIGLHKSVLSRSSVTLEFAKRIFHKGVDVSAVPFKAYFAALGGFGQILEFARKYNLGTLEIAKSLGFRFRALSKVNTGFSSLNYKLKQLIVASSLPTTSEEVVPFLKLGSPRVSPWPMNLEVFFKGFAQWEFRDLLRSMQRRHTAILGERKTFIHLSPNLGEDPLLHSVIRSKFRTVITPDYQDWNWMVGPSRTKTLNLNGEEVSIIEGPSEAKERSKGFMLLDLDMNNRVSQPIDLRPAKRIPLEELQLLDLKDYPVDLSDEDVRTIRRALAPMWDFQILPLRDKLLSDLREIQSLLVKDYIDPSDLAKVFISFLEVSREAALIPSQTVSFKRVSETARGSDPVSIRLWKRWSKYIQGTVHGGFTGTRLVRGVSKKTT